jgi:CDP-6-deoxy-D-xylo-4-hexulose-3-dehydrase
MRQVPKAGAVHDQREIDAVIEVLKNGTLDLGPKVAEMERRGAALFGKQHGVMVNSGSSALRLAIDLLELSPGDEILTSVVTFSTDIAPMLQSQLVPVYVDVEPDTFCVDVAGIEEMIGPRTRALLFPNLVGNCPDWDAIRAIADKRGLKIIEDSCDVLDPVLRGKPTGSRSDITVTSFARTHSITAGGNGGLVAIDGDEMLDRCVTYRRWGRRSESYLFGTRKGSKSRFNSLIDGLAYDDIFVFDTLGHNFEPSEIGAAYGCAQLDKLPEFNRRRRRAFARFDRWFKEHEDKFQRPRMTEGLDATWMHYPFIVREKSGLERVAVQEFMEARGVPTRVIWSGNILRQPGYKKTPHRAPAKGFPNADRVMERGLLLPVHQGLSEDDVEYMVAQLDALLETAK